MADVNALDGKRAAARTVMRADAVDDVERQTEAPATDKAENTRAGRLW
jgi:hypothetical protein